MGKVFAVWLSSMSCIKGKIELKGTEGFLDEVFFCEKSDSIVWIFCSCSSLLVQRLVAVSGEGNQIEQ